MLLPLIVGLFDAWFERADRGQPESKIPVLLLMFLVVDIVARLPDVGPFVRDAGVPFMSLIALMLGGIAVLRRNAGQL
jgi:hypothetical protein